MKWEMGIVLLLILRMIMVEEEHRRRPWTCSRRHLDGLDGLAPSYDDQGYRGWWCGIRKDLGVFFGRQK